MQEQLYFILFCLWIKTFDKNKHILGVSGEDYSRNALIALNQKYINVYISLIYKRIILQQLKIGVTSEKSHSDVHCYLVFR